ncbi:MAG: thioredoxin fold domain-containing protein [FCB group bacterium]|nr:thioredoxin fold domain-containing protein [FCB group bacterium]
MNKQTFTVLIIIIVGMLAIYGFKGQDNGAAEGLDEWREKITWTEPSITGNQIATGGKPVFLFVSTEWCTFCKKMKGSTFLDPGVQELLNDRFVNIIMNPETEGTARFVEGDLSYADLAIKLGVSGYPATFFFSPEGQLIGGQPGYLDVDMFSDLAEYVGGGFYKDYKFNEFMKLPETERL